MKLSFETKIISIFIFIVLGIVGTGIVAYHDNIVNRNTYFWGQHTRKVLYESEEVLSILKDIETGARGFIITRDRSFLEPFNTSNEILFYRINSLNNLIKDNPGQRARVDTLSYLARNIVDLSALCIQSIERSNSPESIKLLSLRQGKIYMDKIRNLVFDIKQDENRLLMEREQASKNIINRSNRTLYILLVGMLMISVISYLILRNNHRLIAQKDDLLKQFNIELEQKVKDRTEELLHTIIERNNIYIELKQSGEKYRDLFALTPLPMYVFDNETFKFLDVNEAAITHYGFSREEFLAMTAKEIRPPEDVDFFQNEVSLNPTSVVLNRVNLTHRKKSGELITVDIRSNLIDFDGTKARIVLATDITERLKYIQAIEDQNKKLRDIAWVQSHLVRAPLARIMGLIEVVKDGTVEEIDKSELLNHIVSSANELDNVIKEITIKSEQVTVHSKAEG